MRVTEKQIKSAIESRDLSTLDSMLDHLGLRLRQIFYSYKDPERAYSNYSYWLLENRMLMIFDFLEQEVSKDEWEAISDMCYGATVYDFLA